MAISLVDTLNPMSEFPVAYAKDIEFEDGENLQDKVQTVLDNNKSIFETFKISDVIDTDQSDVIENNDAGYSVCVIAGSLAIINGNVVSTKSQTNTGWKNLFKINDGWKYKIRNEVEKFYIRGIGGIYKNKSMGYLNSQIGYKIIDIASQPQDQSVVVGKSATFFVSVNTASVQYQWQYCISDTGVWTDISGMTNQSYTIENTTISMDGYQYRCRVYNNEEEIYSDIATLIVNELSVKEINLDSTVLRPASTWKSTDGHKLYFGRYNRRPTLFRVLPQSPDTMSTDVDALFLDCNRALKTMAWSSGTTIWSDSACSIRNWLNGDMYYKSSSVFTEKERAAIAETALKSLSDYTGYDTGNGSYTDDASTEKIFLLSHWEIWNIYMDRSYEGTVPNPDDVWLRTRINARHPEFISYIMGGQPVIYPPTWTEGGVSPAFNLDLSKVLFTSPATTYKTSKTGLTAVSTTTNKTWKTTLLDSERKFTVTDTSDRSVIAGKTFTLPYTGADTGENEYISAMLVDKNGVAQYYGKLKASDTANGSVEVAIPADVPLGSYTLRVFNEQVNGDKLTDYASTFSEIGVTVKDEATISDYSSKDYFKVYYTEDMLNNSNSLNYSISVPVELRTIE